MEVGFDSRSTGIDTNSLESCVGFDSFGLVTGRFGTSSFLSKLLSKERTCPLGQHGPIPSPGAAG